MPNETSEELVQRLVDSFRTVLDEALIVTIAYDYDLQKDLEYKAARTTLEGLAHGAASEEATGFNPSGISNIPDEAVLELSDDVSTSETTNSHQASRNRDTDTSPSDAASSTTESTYLMPRLTTFNNESEEDKVLQLQCLFPELKEYDIKHSLKGANGDFQATLDDLLNIQYLQSTGQQSKGVDGFFQPDEEIGKRKRNKRKGKASVSSLNADSAAEVKGSRDVEKEMKRQDEIAYLADSFNIPFGDVSDIYHRKHCSSGATAVEILDQHILLGIETHDEAGKKYAQELAQKYRNVPEKYMPTVVQFTSSIPQSSEDIAALISKHFAKNPWKQKLDLNYSLTPLPQDDIEGFETVSYGKAAANRGARPLASRASQSADPSAYAQAAEKATRYNQAKREAATSASKLSRRGAGNPLYRQAAGYYSEVAREQGRYAHQATSSAADLLVDTQSTRNSIDLHGVYVQDGVRIARERVQSWWAGLGEFKSERARQQNFTVITGLGRHSAGGVSQLRQAVAAALLQDGWKLQVETGRFVVKGRR